EEEGPLAVGPPAVETLWLEGRCLELETSSGYWLFADLFREHFGFEREKDDRLKNAGPEQVRHQTFLAVHDYLVALSRERPLVLVLEDLHWADTLSLDLVSLLMEALRLGPILLICVYRPEREHRCWQIAATAERKCPERFTMLRPKDLSPSQGRRLIENLLTIDRLSDSVKSLILEKSRGNPFFVEEVIRSLIDSGMIVRENNAWVSKAGIEEIAVPESIQAVILSRVDRLEPHLKGVLQAASVIGRLFGKRLLEEVALPGDHIEASLQLLEDRALIYQERVIPEEEYSFKHVLTRETVYQSILKRRRSLFHRLVAEAIERLYQGSLEEFYVPLWQHWEAAGDVRKCVEYLLKAAGRAYQACANDEALEFYSYALQEGRNLEEKAWRVEAHRGRGMVFSRTGRWHEAEQEFRQAVDLARQIGLPAKERVRLYWWLGDVLYLLNEHEKMLSTAQEGLALLVEGEESTEAAMMHQICCRYVGGSGQEYTEAREHVARYEPYLDRVPYCEELRQAYLWAGLVNILSGTPEKAKHWYQSLLEKAEQHNDLAARAGALLYSAMLAEDIGNFREARSLYQQAREHAAQMGSLGDQGYALDGLRWLLLNLGDIQQAEVENEAPHALERFFAGLVAVYRGQADTASEAFQAALSRLPPRDEVWWRSLTLCALGWMSLARGESHVAKRHFEEGLERASALNGLSRALVLARLCAGVEEASESPEEFRSTLQRLEQTHPSLVPVTFYGASLPVPLRTSFPGSERGGEFKPPLSEDWAWHDPFEDCSLTVDDGLKIRAVNGRAFWEVNCSAPRLLRPAYGDFAIQTTCEPVSPQEPAIGGLLIWQDRGNYLDLCRGWGGSKEVTFRGRLNGRTAFIGRGRLTSERMFLRLERHGGQVDAFCSPNGEDWYSVGSSDWLVNKEAEVGVYAGGVVQVGGSIRGAISSDRLAYPGGSPDGTAIRFINFLLQSATHPSTRTTCGTSTRKRSSCSTG
ncbi:MAG: AAA family ATPase, partial [Chloroflexi bacterium]|nr:AAA family ATPase [Chloroflexota bacterium]